MNDNDNNDMYMNVQNIYNADNINNIFYLSPN